MDETEKRATNNSAAQLIRKFSNEENREESQKKISEFSEKKKYNFTSGLNNDLETTRAYLQKLENNRGYVTFGELFEDSWGRIANLNRVLQRMKQTGEITYNDNLEIFLQGKNDNEKIILVKSAAKFNSNSDNCFKKELGTEIPVDQRRGRDYFTENEMTKNVKICSVCNNDVNATNRLCYRGKVYHRGCVTCSWCKSNPGVGPVNVAFDGSIVCSDRCMQFYDGANQKQNRN